MHGYLGMAKNKKTKAQLQKKKKKSTHENEVKIKFSSHTYAIGSNVQGSKIVMGFWLSKCSPNTNEEQKDEEEEWDCKRSGYLVPI